jgi:hypothetical protein
LVAVAVALQTELVANDRENATRSTMCGELLMSTAKPHAPAKLATARKTILNGPSIASVATVTSSAAPPLRKSKAPQAAPTAVPIAATE